MKTMEELYKEIVASEELTKEFAETVKDKDTLESFLKKYDCSASAEEAAAFLKAQTENFGELDNSSLDAVAGGGVSFGSWFNNWTIS